VTGTQQYQLSRLSHQEERSSWKGQQWGEQHRLGRRNSSIKKKKKRLAKDPRAKVKKRGKSDKEKRNNQRTRKAKSSPLRPR